MTGIQECLAAVLANVVVRQTPYFTYIVTTGESQSQEGDMVADHW